MSNLRKFAISALLIAVAFALSFVKIIHLPFGGMVTAFSMLFAGLPAYFFGIKYGFMASIVYSLIHIIVDPYIIHPFQVFLDYILPFSCFGIIGFFKDMKYGLQIGYVIACFIRFFSSALSGYIFFSDYAPETWNPIVYTIVYNASYVFTECILTLIFLSLKPVKKLLKDYKMRFDK